MRVTLGPRRLHVVVLLLGLGLACGGDDDDDGGDSDDGQVADAAPDNDAGDDPDASIGETTACPPTPDLRCNAATEICVVSTPVGPAETSACEPLPDGCQAERTCGCAGAELCTGAFDTCSESEAENTIVCECPECQ
jgi:hypothetical protein